MQQRVGELTDPEVIMLLVLRTIAVMWMIVIQAIIVIHLKHIHTA